MGYRLSPRGKSVLSALPERFVELVISVDDPGAQDVRDLLVRHLAFAHESSPPQHVHALDVQRLQDPTVTFFSARLNGELLGVGALRRLDGLHAEIKSMHTAEGARGQGVGGAVVEHLLSVAAESGYRRVSLETGSTDDFEPARRLYLKTGFRPCAPFAEYTDNPYSICMTIAITPTTER